ncbi:hypothetical protein ACL02O_23755 [Micromonospora sp. MS34]|uniref:hypothetical protein n=1 Tax=Micromonospora sp. MS34 TaxID=3385971 RepID=UPI00399F197D
MLNVIQRMPRTVVRVSVALVVAVVAGTVAVLALTAAARAWSDLGAAVLLALAAVWIPQALITAARHRRH